MQVLTSQNSKKYMAEHRILGFSKSKNRAFANENCILSKKSCVYGALFISNFTQVIGFYEKNDCNA